MSSQKESISEQLLALLNPVPVHADPEADVHEETTAKVVEKDDIDDLDYDESLSVFRKQNVNLIEETDESYKGKKISRKHIAESAWEEIGSDDDENDAVSDKSHENTEIDTDATSEASLGTDVADSEDISGAEEEDADDDPSISSHLQPSETETSFKHLSEQNINAEVGKGNAIRNQLSLCDGLVECRIQMQKSFAGANRLPRADSLSEFMHQGSDSFSSAMKQTKNSVKKLLDKLLELQSEKLHLFPETRIIGKHKSEGDSDGDEITSEDEEVNKVEEHIKPVSKSRKLNDYSSLLAEQHQHFRDYRNSTIQKWNDKTRVTLGKVKTRNFSAFEQSTVRQIEQTLMNRQRLIRRTQMKRSSYKVLGKEKVIEEKPTEEVDSETMEDKLKEYDVEIFDDDDFYHQLLRELIERKAADVTDPMRLRRQWLELQKVRSKMKRKIDARATKGRKVRYTQHMKLVNFMAPVADVEWNNEARNDLYNSLFGKN